MHDGNLKSIITNSVGTESRNREQKFRKAEYETRRRSKKHFIGIGSDRTILQEIDRNM